MQSYWHKVLSSRISRRRALAASGVTALASALLVACGGGDSEETTDDPAARDRSGLLSQRQDTTAQARRGGIFQQYRNPEAREIDPHTVGGIAGHQDTTPHTSTLLRFQAGFGETPSPDTIAGDAAESYELAPDGTRITLKLRQNHRFDPRPPTNHRAMNSEDVRWSFERTSEISATSGDFVHSVAQAGPVERISTPDDHTVVLDLAYPYGPITEMLAYWFLYILPIEADGQYDPRRESRGSGPWRIESWDADIGFNYVRNDDWYMEDRPFLDGINKILLPEYASALAQFESANIWNMTVRSEDILPVKTRHPDMVMLQQVRGGSPGQFNLHFGLGREDSLFRDVRTRRALSMMYDRDAFLNVFANVDIFEDAGLPVQTFWDSHLASQSFNWVDPRHNTDLGEAQKFFMYDLEEAKKLMSAAGWDPNQEVEHRFRNVGDTMPNHASVLAGMFEEGGLRIRLIPETQPEWLETKFSKGTSYQGLWGSTANSYNDDGFLFTKYTPGGRDAVSDKPLEDGITDAILNMRSEIDPQRRSEMIKQIQVDLAYLMPDISAVSTLPALGFTLRWPWLKNHGIWAQQGFSEDASTARANLNFWYDEELHRRLRG